MRSTSVAIACIILGATGSLAVLDPNARIVHAGTPSGDPSKYKLQYNSNGQVIAKKHNPDYGGEAGYSSSVVSAATSGTFGGSFASGHSVVSTASSSRTVRPSNRSGSRAGSQVSSASSGTYRGGSRHGSQVSSASSGTWGGSSASSTSGRDRGGNAPASRAPQTYGSRVQQLRGAPPKDAKIKNWASNVSGGSGSTVSTSSSARSSVSHRSSRHREVKPSDSVSQITPRYRKRTLENLERRGSRLASHDLDKLASLIARRYDHLQDLTRRHFDQDLEVFARDLDLDQLN